MSDKRKQGRESKMADFSDGRIQNSHPLPPPSKPVDKPSKVKTQDDDIRRTYPPPPRPKPGPKPVDKPSKKD